MMSIMVTPDGYEMTIPVFDKSFDGIVAFIGADTATPYDHAMIRTGQEPEIVSIKLLKLSNFMQIAHWFAISSQQGDFLTKTCVNWMSGVASCLEKDGFSDGDVVSVQQASEAIRDELSDEES